MCEYADTREIAFNNIRICLAQACDLCWLMSALWALNIIIKSSNGATHSSTGRRPVLKSDFPGADTCRFVSGAT